MGYGNILLANVQFYSLREGDSILIKNGKVIAIGWMDNLMKKASKSTIIYDCKNSFAIPGLVDAHMHLLPYALSRNQLDLKNIKSIEELKNIIAEKARKIGPGKWIIGRGWDQEKFVEKRMPNRWDLDKAAPRNPVFLTRICGHVAVVNSYTLKLMKLTDNSPDPVGGALGREDGRLNGLLYEGAIDIVREYIGRPSFDEAVNSIILALNEAARYGLVELHVMSVDEFEYNLLRYMDENNLLKMKIKAYLEPTLAYNIDKLYQGCMLRTCGVKLFADGSFGARTAYLREAYNDLPGTKGILLLDNEAMSSLILETNKRGMDVAVHAIGDGAIEELLRIVEKEKVRNVRLEHASLTPPDIIDKLAELEIPVSVQPHFILSDWWIVDRLGPIRCRWVYAYKSLLSEGVLIGASSDSPVEPLNPWLGVYAAVDRGKLEQLPLWKYSSNEALKTEEAIQLYVSGRNLAKRNYKAKVTDLLIREKMPADIVLVENGIPSKVNDLKKIKIRATIVNGEIVYSRGIANG